MMKRAVVGAVGCGCYPACWRADPVSGTDHDPEVTASMSTPLDLEPGATSAEPESVLQGEKRIEGRSLGQIAWSRLKRDKVALAGGFFVLYLIVVAIAAPLVVGLLGHPPNEFHQELIDPNTQIPIGPYGGMSWDFLYGLEPVNGRDIFSRVVYGSQVSLLIAFLATLLSVVISTVLGIVAAFFGGVVDTFISRTMDVFLAFPLLVFALALAGVVPDEAFGLKGDTLRISVIVFIIVYSTLLIPTNILFEAGLSFLGVGVQPPTATWGGMLSDAAQWYQIDPWFMLWPGLAIFVTVLAFNLFGDGLRDALDPRSR